MEYINGFLKITLKVRIRAEDRQFLKRVVEYLICSNLVHYQLVALPKT